MSPCGEHLAEQLARVGQLRIQFERPFERAFGVRVTPLEERGGAGPEGRGAGSSDRAAKRLGNGAGVARCSEASALFQQPITGSTCAVAGAASSRPNRSAADRRISSIIFSITMTPPTPAAIHDAVVEVLKDVSRRGRLAAVADLIAVSADSFQIVTICPRGVSTCHADGET